MEQEQLIKKKRSVDFFLDKGILISTDFIEPLAKEGLEELYGLITVKIKSKDFLVLSKDLHTALQHEQLVEANWFDLEKAKSMLEKGKDRGIYRKFLDYLGTEIKPEDEMPKEVNVVVSHERESKKRAVQDFVQYFNARFKTLENILKKRHELQNTTTINRILNKKDKENLSIIGMVKEKVVSRGSNITLLLEDQTGTIKILVNKNKPELYESAKSIVHDEVIGIAGVNSDKIIFANNIYWPEIPANKDIKKGEEECYAAFLSDLHVGSKNFLHEDFDRFLKWINGEIGSEEQREISKKIKYIFIVGDMVDGVGIYPEQAKELEIEGIYEQYKACASLLKKIPLHINLIICPGNHDAVRLAEPQPPLTNEFTNELCLANATMVSNPAVVTINATKSFSGFQVLLYHGYSFDYFVSNVDMIRNSGGYNRADIIMKFLLQRRHLAPAHTSTLYVPDAVKDPLAIDIVPDFFVTGHLHKSVVANYKSITMICGSCWQSKTIFQERMGHTPEPSRVPVVNLRTREVKILKFGK